MGDDCVPEGELYPSFVLIALATVTLIVLWTLYVKHGICVSDNNNDSNTVQVINRIKITGFLALTSYMLSNIIFLIETIHYVDDPCYNYSSIVTSFGWLFNFLGISFILMLFCVRIYYTFKETKYDLKQRTVLLLKMFSIITCIISIILSIIGALSIIDPRYLSIISVTLLLVYLIGVILLIRLFIKKLWQVIYDIKNYDDHENNDLLLILTCEMIKYTILVLITACSTFIAWIFIPIMQRISHENSLSMRFMIGSIDSIVGSVCLILQYSFAKSFYKSICGRCDSFCQSRYYKINIDDIQAVEINDNTKETFDKIASPLSV